MKTEWRFVLMAELIISLTPMLLYQYGVEGISEISGIINLFNPVGILSLIIFFIGIFVPFRRLKPGFILGLIGTAGIVISEIYTFMTWHIMTITGQISIQSSIMLARPSFYLGLFVSLAMVVAYIYTYRKITDI